jgi:hypothetical protein
MHLNAHVYCNKEVAYTPTVKYSPVINMQACTDDLVPEEDKWFIPEPEDSGQQPVRAATSRVSTVHAHLTGLACIADLYQCNTMLSS